MRQQLLNSLPRPWLIRLSYIARPLLSFWYKGKTYTDPINGKSYRKFLSYGYGEGRENALSPGTLSLERHRLMWLYLKRNSDFFQLPLQVLHMAPEQVFLSIFQNQNNLEYTTADLYSPIVKVKADILNLPFENDSFDVIFCNHVLEHIAEDAQAMSELYRVMKPGGWGIFQVPMRITQTTTYEDFSITSAEERKKHFGQYDHVRWYGLDYFERLRNAGFLVEEFKVNEHFSPEEITRYALWQNEILPVVSKRPS